MNVKTAKKIVAHGKRQIIPDEEEKKIFFFTKIEIINIEWITQQ